MIWFTADTHYNHGNIIEYASRPFSNLKEMTDKLIGLWNDRVKPGDTVYHLGDFCLSWGKKHADCIDLILRELKGNKFLITGNHDREEVTGNKRWIKAVPYHELKVDMGGKHKQKIVLCHYAMRTWNQMNRGAWMLHGHSHGNLCDVGGKILDVGVDCHGYSPVNIEEIAELMKEREHVVCDHHRGDDEK
jgi:calcineurin-like phosphoesterase family protein